MRQRPHNPGRVEFWDARNEGYRIRAVAPRAAQTVDEIVRDLLAAGTRARYHFGSGWTGDQGQTSMCTAYSSLTYRVDGPVRPPKGGPVPPRDPAAHYAAIQARDKAAGRDYGVDGGATSLAMAKELVALGWCGEYRWGKSLAELVAALVVEPVILGVDWLTNMFSPDSSGRIRARGQMEGGHEIVADGINLAARTVRLHNTWSRSWGRGGFCTISFDDLQMLIEQRHGDVLLTREMPTSAR
jgi:hypothetical protein